MNIAEGIGIYKNPKRERRDNNDYVKYHENNKESDSKQLAANR